MEEGANMVSETLEALTEVEVTDSEAEATIGAAEALGEISLEPAPEKPGMAATMAFVNWMRRNEVAGYGVCGIAEYKRDDQGLYIDKHGSKVYLG